MHCYSHFTLCWGHDGVSSPAEFWELLGVEAKAYRPGVRGDAILHLIPQVVQAGEVVVRCWLIAGAAHYVLPTLALSRHLVTPSADGPTHITLAALTAKIVPLLQQVVALLTCVTGMAAHVGLAETLPTFLLTLSYPTQGPFDITVTLYTAAGVLCC